MGGDDVAQYNLARYYYYGIGVERDYGLAVEWFTRSAKQGNSDAQYRLGSCYYYGIGVEQNYNIAVSL